METTWTNNGQAYRDKFIVHAPGLSKRVKSSPHPASSSPSSPPTGVAACMNPAPSASSLPVENLKAQLVANPRGVSTSMKQRVCQSVIEKALAESDYALFSREILQLGRKYRADLSLQGVKTALWRMTKQGRLHRFDDNHRGWKFANGYLYALPDSKFGAAARIDRLDKRVTTHSERLFIARVKGGLWLASDLRDVTHLSPDSITHMTRKFGRSAPIRIRSEGQGYDYHVIALEDTAVPIEGHGLLPWLRWVNVFGQLLIFDESTYSAWMIREYATKAGYWLSAEGKRRQGVGREWEAFSKEFFDACDRTHAWQLGMVEHRQNWKGRSGHEFDHVYACRLGPMQIGLDLTIVFECKAGFISVNDVDSFLESLVAESEFRNYATGGLKQNVLPVMLTGRRAENSALIKAKKIGIRIVLHTSMEDVIAELKGQPRKTFHRILKESGLLINRRSQTENPPRKPSDPTNDPRQSETPNGNQHPSQLDPP